MCGINSASGDAVVIMMADESDDCRDVVRYWQMLNEGYDAVFGSRFIKGGGVIDYPWIKYWHEPAWPIGSSRCCSAFRSTIRRMPSRRIACRPSNGLRPFLSPHFNLTVELPLKTIVRGYSWTVIPITWRNRRSGVAKLKIREMGSRYLFIVFYVWLEKYFSRGDYRKSENTHADRSSKDLAK